MPARDDETKSRDIRARYDRRRAREVLPESAGAAAQVDRQALRTDLRPQRDRDNPGRQP